MTEATKRIKQFDEDFRKLKANRANIPLKELTTRYASSYNALCERITEYVVWYAREYILACENLAGLDARTVAIIGKAELEIITEEKQPGGLYDQMWSALIDDLDEKKFEDLVYQLWQRLDCEVYSRYTGGAE